MMESMEFEAVHGNPDDTREFESLRMILSWCLMTRLDILGVLLDLRVVHLVPHGPARVL